MSSVLFTVIVYASEGFIILIFNVVLAISIFLSKPLRQRKEMVFIAGLAVSDAIYGIGCAEYGRDELFGSYFSNDSSLPMSPWQCFLKPREWIIVYSYQVSMLIMCAISAERLISVVSFHKYAKIRYRSHVYVLITAYLLPLISVVAAGIETNSKSLAGAMQANDCLAYSQVFSKILPVVMLTMGLSTSLLYLAVLIAYRSKSSAASNSQQTIRNRRLTQTLALITGCMLLFYCVPLIIARIMTSYYIYSYLLYIYMLMPLQYIAHVLVFYWRQKEIRESVRDLLCCHVQKKSTRVSTVFS